MDNLVDKEWLNETISSVDKCNWLYQILCFCLGKRKKKLTYQEFFLILYGINRKTLGEKKAKSLSMIRIIEIYKYLHNNKLPKGMEENDDE